MSAVAAALHLTGVGGLVHFPQLDTPVEPDDGTEGNSWQHAFSSSKNLLAGCYWNSLEKGFPSDRPRVVGSPRLNQVARLADECQGGKVSNPLWLFQISHMFGAGIMTDL